MTDKVAMTETPNAPETGGETVGPGAHNQGNSQNQEQQSTKNNNNQNKKNKH